jgi:hypothetical protein
MSDLLVSSSYADDPELSVTHFTERGAKIRLNQKLIFD